MLRGCCADLTNPTCILNVLGYLATRGGFVYVDGLLPIASSMAMAAKVPARPWPLMKMVLYFWGSIPTRPNRLPCSTAPNAGKRNNCLIQCNSRPSGLLTLCTKPGRLTVDEPDSRHSDREEMILLHGHFDQYCSEDEEQQHEDQAACDADRLRDPETTDAHISHIAKNTTSILDAQYPVTHKGVNIKRIFMLTPLRFTKKKDKKEMQI